MTKYLITFPTGAMDHVPVEEMAEVGRAAHAVCREAISAGAYVVSGGMATEPGDLVGTDGTVSAGAVPTLLGGITIVDVPTREEALEWAAKFAAACRCAQEVRAVMDDAELEAMLGEVAGAR